MKFSAAVVLAAAMGASAHPSRHGHREAHRSVGAREFVMAKKPAPPAPVTSAPAPAPAPPPPATSSAAPAISSAAPVPSSAAPLVAAAAAAVDTSFSSASVPSVPSVTSVASAPSSTTSSSPSSSSSSSSSSSGSGAYQPFCGGVTKRVTKRATAAEIAYVGNVGSPGKYGCNMMTIPSNIASQYDYTMRFVNKGSSNQQCKCWNKIGPDGGINGFFNGNEALTFNMAAGGEQYVAVEANSQVGCSCGANSVPLTKYGQFAATWFEGDFENTSNKGYSGFDASCLVAAANNLNIPGMNVCGDNVCSTINPGGTGTNAYLGGMEALDGVGGNVKPGPLAVTIYVDTQ